jgi:Ser/Thr protein kinase RdoA (MazF antagonist)
MEQQIKNRYNDSILTEAMQRYGISSDQIWPLAATENFVYEFEHSNRNHILRIGHSLRRSEAQIEGEVDWLNYLAAGGISIAQAVASENGNFVEAVNDGQGGQFLVTAFVKARGRPAHDLWTPALYTAFGQLLGRMHALAEHYQPSQSSWRRPEWDDDIMDYVARHLPASEIVAKQKYQELCAHLRMLPKDGRCYGLVHFDAHGGNILVDDAGRLTIFDFDECTYSWYANDIAIALFAVAINAPDVPAATREFMTHFLKGYRSVYTIDKQWLEEMPIFLKMVEIFLYAVIHRDFDINNITDGWLARFMTGRKHKVEHDIPCIDFDFKSLATLI